MMKMVQMMYDGRSVSDGCQMVQDGYTRKVCQMVKMVQMVSDGTSVSFGAGKMLLLRSYIELILPHLNQLYIYKYEIHYEGSHTTLYYCKILFLQARVTCIKHVVIRQKTCPHTLANSC